MNDNRKISVRGDTLAYAHVCYDHLERDLKSISEIIIHSSTKKYDLRDTVLTLI